MPKPSPPGTSCPRPTLSGSRKPFTAFQSSIPARFLKLVWLRIPAVTRPVCIWSAGTLPELQHVAHTNFCDIGFALDKSGRRLVIVSCLDNLGKGAAGQAVQNFNHMLGIEEQTSLQ